MFSAARWKSVFISLNFVTGSAAWNRASFKCLALRIKCEFYFIFLLIDYRNNIVVNDPIRLERSPSQFVTEITTKKQDRAFKNPFQNTHLLMSFYKPEHNVSLVCDLCYEQCMSHKNINLDQMSTTPQFFPPKCHRNVSTYLLINL